jgi:lipid-A-disaccharide synthase-like uncharacterized protein
MARATERWTPEWAVRSYYRSKVFILVFRAFAAVYGVLCLIGLFVTGSPAFILYVLLAAFWVIMSFWFVKNEQEILAMRLATIESMKRTQQIRDQWKNYGI